MRKRGRTHVGRQGPQNDRRLIALVTASYKVSGRYPCMYLEVNPTCNQESNQHRVGGYPQELTPKFTNGGPRRVASVPRFSIRPCHKHSY